MGEDHHGYHQVMCPRIVSMDLDGFRVIVIFGEAVTLVHGSPYP